MISIKKIFKSILDFFPDSEYTCPKCKQGYVWIPGGPDHKCDPEKLIQVTVLEMKRKGEI